ncbi:MAG: cysteine desulfurase [Chromatiales bacterium]|nr:cysteine desulfurase [Chromatiales bacterium]
MDVAAVRRDFPVLDQEINGHPLAYLDNAASYQRPTQVIDAIAHYYRHDHANVHRGVHTLSHRATEAYEGARDKVQRFINAQSRREIIFTRGTTESINLIAAALGSQLSAGDEVVITHLEHHSNIVPWQLLCESRGILLKVVPINSQGEIELDRYFDLLGPRTRLVSVAQVSNALGTVLPLQTIIAAARERDILVLVDGAQGIAHQPVDVQTLDCDFYAFSGHKMCGPTGIGVLYARESILQTLPPWQGGGDMIRTVSFSGSTWNDLPYRFEAGTPNIAGAIGLGAAIDYLENIGIQQIAEHERRLLEYGEAALADVPGLRIIGTAMEKVSVISFDIEGIHPHDLGTVLDHQGVAIRAGHHCAMPVMEFFGVAGTARASFAFYNTTGEIDQLRSAIDQAIVMFR